jgi:hypothetical protein
MDRPAASLIGEKPRILSFLAGLDWTGLGADVWDLMKIYRLVGLLSKLLFIGEYMVELKAKSGGNFFEL